MDTLHSETLDFLVHALKAKYEQLGGAKSARESKACKAAIAHLRKRMALEFHYQAHGEGAEDSPK